jgi:hypothetical protein
MRRWLTVVTTGLLAAALPAMALGAVLWSLTISPQTATQGQPKVFSLTATNHDGSTKIGCLEVDLPASFVILSLGTPNASNGDSWDSSPSGANSVEVQSDDGGGRLDDGESVTFTITSRPTAAGTFSWTNHAHVSHACDGGTIPGSSLTVTVAPSGSTPTPVPTPVATPPPTPKPGSTATPRPAATPFSTPGPGAATPSGSPTPTPAASRTPDASSSERPSTPAPGTLPGGPGTGGSNDLRLAPLGDSPNGGADSIGTGLDILAMLDGQFVWFVPGAAVGVPGLLVIAFVGLQALGAMVWIPATRRLSGEDERTGRRPLRPA